MREIRPRTLPFSFFPVHYSLSSSHSAFYILGSMSDIIAVKWNVIWRRQLRCAVSRTVRLDVAEWRGTSSPVLFFSSSVPGRLLFSHRLRLLDNV